MNALSFIPVVNADGHSPLGASSFARRALCPASLQMENGREDAPSPYALEGTAAHITAEQCFESDCDAADLIGEHWREAPGFPVTEEMARHVQEYVDYVRSIEGEKHIEQRVDYSPWVPHGHGTADAIIVNAEERRITVVDLKYGTGVKVNAEGNWQPVLYALGAWNEFNWAIDDPITVEMVIHQPRLDHVSTWNLTHEELLDWGRRAREVAELALSQDPPFNPSEDACRFCKAKADCKPLAEHALRTARQAFGGFGRPYKVDEVESLGDERLAFCLDQADLLDTWTKALRARAYQQIERGVSIPGWKLVEGRSNRKWGDEEAVTQALEAELGPDAFTRKLITPPQAEKLLGKKHELLAEHVVKPAGKPTLVRDSDRRQELPPSAVRAFS